MKLPDPRHLRQTPIPAPALGRGLALWVLLNQESPLMLEDMAARLALPKASAYRLLESLCRLGFIRRRPDKRFEPCWMPQSLADPRERLREEMAGRMADLCRSSRCTAEWYEPSPEGMVLLLQNHPDSEVRVQARPGFLRRWGDEFEAVNRLGLALAEEAPEPKSARLHTANGLLQPIGVREIRRYLADARKQFHAVDPAFNGNGVRRCAVALMEGRQLRGVLALAEVFQFHTKSRPAGRLALLARHLPK